MFLICKPKKQLYKKDIYKIINILSNIYKIKRTKFKICNTFSSYNLLNIRILYNNTYIHIEISKIRYAIYLNDYMYYTYTFINGISKMNILCINYIENENTNYNQKKSIKLESYHTKYKKLFKYIKYNGLNFLLVKMYKKHLLYNKQIYCFNIKYYYNICNYNIYIYKENLFITHVNMYLLYIGYKLYFLIY